MDAFAAWLHATPFSQTIQSVRWIVPLLQSIHILMIGIVFISSLMIALRVLERVRADEPFAAVWTRFAPWFWSALVVMVVTGLLLVVGEPAREFNALSFWIKMALLADAVVLTLVLRRNGAAATGGTRAVAVALVVTWIAIIFLGRAIAYDVEVWGHWSPSA
jgi:uncharacterized membrane protein SirB2